MFESQQIQHTDHVSDSKKSGVGFSSPSLKHSTESDILQHFYAELNSSISDPDVFAAQLIQHKFTTRQTADNKMPLGILFIKRLEIFLV